jgi:hypothetical protein
MYEAPKNQREDRERILKELRERVMGEGGVALNLYTNGQPRSTQFDRI